MKQNILIYNIIDFIILGRIPNKTGLMHVQLYLFTLRIKSLTPHNSKQLNMAGPGEFSLHSMLFLCYIHTFSILFPTFTKFANYLQLFPQHFHFHPVYILFHDRNMLHMVSYLDCPALHAAEEQELSTIYDGGYTFTFEACIAIV